MNKFKVNSEVGFLEPALTGISIGIFYLILYNIFSILSLNIKVKEHEIIVNPNFKENVFKLNLLCIFSMRVGNIIYVSFRIAFLVASIYFRLYQKNLRKKIELNLNIN